VVLLRLVTTSLTNVYFELYRSGLIRTAPCSFKIRPKTRIDALLFDYTRLNFCPDAKRSITVDNAGGKSELSEMVSIQYFHDVMRGTDFVLEMEVEYWVDYKMVDFIVDLPIKTGGVERVGVSVTRAMKFGQKRQVPRRKKVKNAAADKVRSSTFTANDALRLLNKKLFGLVVSRDTVVERHSFNRSILHVLCQTREIAELCDYAYHHLLDLDSLGVSDCVEVIFTVCPNQFVYTNKMNCAERSSSIVVG